MTDLILKCFVPNRTDDTNPGVRSAIGRTGGLVGIGCNIFLFIVKLAVGLLSGSVAVTADAVNNLSDASSSIVTYLGFRLAERPADDEHPFGHARFEYLSGLAVAAMIIVIGIELAKTSIKKIIVPSEVTFDLITAGVLIFSILIKLWLSGFYRKLGRMIDSAPLLASSADSRNDFVSTSAVLLALIIGAVTPWQTDGIMGLGVAIFILWSGAGLAKETISPLLGEAASPELKKQIIDAVKAAPKVLGYHDLMVHDYGPGQRFASIHVEMDMHEDPMECHEIIDDIERECLEKLRVHLVVHYDPIVTDDEELAHLRSRVLQILKGIDPRLEIHDFRMVRGAGHSNLIFDAVLPHGLEDQGARIKAELDRFLLQQEGPGYNTVITFDSASFQDAEGQ